MLPGVSALFQICFAASNNVKEGFLQKIERAVRGLAQVPFFQVFLCGKGIVQVPYGEIENILMHATLHLGPKFVYLWKVLVKEM